MQIMDICAQATPWSANILIVWLQDTFFPILIIFQKSIIKMETRKTITTPIWSGVREKKIANTPHKPI